MSISEALAYTGLVTSVATVLSLITPAAAVTYRGRLWGAFAVVTLGVISAGLFVAAIWTGVQW